MQNDGRKAAFRRLFLYISANSLNLTKRVFYGIMKTENKSRKGDDMKKSAILLSLILVLLLCFAGCDEKNDFPDDWFAGDCGVTAVAEVQKSELDWLDVKLDITNKTEKEIIAVKFFAVLLNKQGNPIGGDTGRIFMQPCENFPIPAQKSVTESVTVTQQVAYSLELYVIYVEYADGSTWGAKDVNADQISESAPTVPVTVIVPGVGSGS